MVIKVKSSDRNEDDYGVAMATHLEDSVRNIDFSFPRHDDVCVQKRLLVENHSRIQWKNH